MLFRKGSKLSIFNPLVCISTAILRRLQSGTFLRSLRIKLFHEKLFKVTNRNIHWEPSLTLSLGVCSVHDVSIDLAGVDENTIGYEK